MHPIIRTVLAVIAGVILSFCVILLAEWLSAHYFPSDKLYPTIKEMEEMIAQSPMGAKMIFLAGHAFSSFFGSYLAARIAHSRWKLLAGLTVGFLLLLGGIVLFISLAHPLWLALCTCVSYILFSYLASLLARG